MLLSDMSERRSIRRPAMPDFFWKPSVALIHLFWNSRELWSREALENSLQSRIDQFRKWSFLPSSLSLSPLAFPLRGLPYMTSAKFSGFDPSPLSLS